jgi:hypothetical protein
MENPDQIDRIRQQFRQTAEALEQVRARELLEMTDEEAWRQIKLLKVSGTPWRQRDDWSGLVEQQAYFMRGKKG